jgi:hypothetical protein
MFIIFNKLNQEYEYTLETGYKRSIVVHGPPKSISGFEITVDGVKGDYPDVKSAIGGAYQSVVECN